MADKKEDIIDVMFRHMTTYRRKFDRYPNTIYVSREVLDELKRAASLQTSAQVIRPEFGNEKTYRMTFNGYPVREVLDCDPFHIEVA